MKTLAIANQKGGVGKTSTTVNLAFALKRAGKRVLLVDLDPQASLTEYFLENSSQIESTVFTLLVKSTPIQPLSITVGIDLLPSNIDLAAAELILPAKMNKERKLSQGLKNYQRYDFAIIDCPPSLGVLTTNALTAADLLLIPVATELMAERTVKLILDTVDEIRTSELNPGLKLWRILPTMFDTRLLHNKEIFDVLKTKHDWLVYGEPVKLTTKYKDAVTSKSDIGEFDRDLGEYWDRLAMLLLREE